jgi:hypothetical protein
MPSAKIPKPIKYTAVLKHVREVALSGTADLTFWKDRLQQQNLLPAERDGRARVLIIAAAGNFAGIRFQELSFSILLSRTTDAGGDDGAYLLQAFNSSRFFAFCERTFFSTPYLFGTVEVSTGSPVSIKVVDGPEVVFRAEMQAASAVTRESSFRQTDGWEGPVYLPKVGRKRDSQRHFFARISGATKVYPFLHATDSVTISRSHGGEALQSLIDSNFIATEWAVREDATHSKSKTYMTG